MNSYQDRRNYNYLEALGIAILEDGYIYQKKLNSQNTRSIDFNMED